VPRVACVIPDGAAGRPPTTSLDHEHAATLQHVRSVTPSALPDQRPTGICQRPPSVVNRRTHCLSHGQQLLRRRRNAMSFSEDPTRGAIPGDDPTRGAGGPGADPTQGAEVGATPDEDPTAAPRGTGDPHDDPTQGAEVGELPGEDPTE
jgi:hypothetical protein